MRWLIVEDALRDRKGHWFEYLSTFHRGLRALGDEVVILADGQAETFITENLGAKSVLPPSIWHRMGDGAGALTRYLRVPQHAWQTYRAMKKVFAWDKDWNTILVPTVLVHHLLAWCFIYPRLVREQIRAHLILFFPNLPIRLDDQGTPHWNPAPTTLLMRLLLHWRRMDISCGNIILGVETEEMRTAFGKLTNLPVTYFPHPVDPVSLPTFKPFPGAPRMSCYGPGRPEKGSDILLAAVQACVAKDSAEGVSFEFQWTGDFQDSEGRTVSLPKAVEESPRVNVIKRYFVDGEYAEHLLQTSVMLLPYRRSSYGLRVSRVLIEALVNGIPVVVTDHTTLSSQMDRFGSGLSCADGDVKSLLAAITQPVSLWESTRRTHRHRQQDAIAHFSVAEFRRTLTRKTS
jgi:glycosyltransferase involved in cell wall biosynthesis